MSYVSPSLSFGQSPQYWWPDRACPNRPPQLRRKAHELECKIHTLSVSHGGYTYLSSDRLLVLICNADSFGLELFFRSEVVTVGSAQTENSVSNYEQYPRKLGFRISAARPCRISKKKNCKKNPDKIIKFLDFFDWFLELKNSHIWYPQTTSKLAVTIGTFSDE